MEDITSPMSNMNPMAAVLLSHLTSSPALSEIPAVAMALVAILGELLQVIYPQCPEDTLKCFSGAATSLMYITALNNADIVQAVTEVDNLLVMIVNVIVTPPSKGITNEDLSIHDTNVYFSMSVLANVMKVVSESDIVIEPIQNPLFYVKLLEEIMKPCDVVENAAMYLLVNLCANEGPHLEAVIESDILVKLKDSYEDGDAWICFANAVCCAKKEQVDYCIANHFIVSLTESLDDDNPSIIVRMLKSLVSMLQRYEKYANRVDAVEAIVDTRGFSYMEKLRASVNDEIREWTGYLDELLVDGSDFCV
jgi:hypothetical protein